MHYLFSRKKKLRVPYSTHKVASKNNKKNIMIILVKCSSLDDRKVVSTFRFNNENCSLDLY